MVGKILFVVFLFMTLMSAHINEKAPMLEITINTDDGSVIENPMG